MKEVIRIPEMAVKYNQNFIPRLVSERAYDIDKSDLFDTYGIDMRNIPLILDYIYDIRHLMEENAFVFGYGNGTLIGFYHVAKGESNSVNVSIEAIGRFLTFSGANSFVFVHNHPNGNPILSKEDYDLTNKLIEYSNMMGIELLEHIIIGKHDWSENLILVKSMPDGYNYKKVYQEQEEYFSMKTNKIFQHSYEIEDDDDDDDDDNDEDNGSNDYDLERLYKMF